MIVKTTIFIIIIYFLRATCFDSFESSSGPLDQCFSTFVRPRPGKLFFFMRRRPGPNKFTRKYLPNFFLSSYIKLTYVLIINYGIIIKSISTLMYTVWYVDKYKITFKIVINHWTNEILVTDICYTDVI